MSCIAIQLLQLESQHNKGGIPRVTPYILAHIVRCLPPILYRLYRNPISSYSKAPRGLSVLLRVTGVFTSTTISPGPLLRQRSDRYTFRAGRNLPDKEFRYLRTVIVTAAVYWDFDQELAPHQLIFQHRAGVTPYTSTFVFAECCVFIKQSQPPIYCNRFGLPLYKFTYLRHTFSRSYGINLPSSFSAVLSSALEYSSRAPVSVCGTVTQ